MTAQTFDDEKHWHVWNDGFAKGQVSRDAEIAELKADYGRACHTVALMHKAAVGEITGPTRGAVEDVADLLTRCLEAERLNKVALEAMKETQLFLGSEGRPVLHRAIKEIEGSKK